MDLEKIVADLKSERDRLDRAIALLSGDSAAPKRTAITRTAPKTAAPTQTTTATKRGGLTPAGRKRLSDAMKKRWAERRRKS